MGFEAAFNTNFSVLSNDYFLIISEKCTAQITKHIQPIKENDNSSSSAA